MVELHWKDVCQKITIKCVNYCMNNMPLFKIFDENFKLLDNYKIFNYLLYFLIKNINLKKIFIILKTFFIIVNIR